MKPGQYACTECEFGVLKVQDAVYAECDFCGAEVLRTEAGI